MLKICFLFSIACSLAFAQDIPPGSDTSKAASPIKETGCTDCLDSVSFLQRRQLHLNQLEEFIHSNRTQAKDSKIRNDWTSFGAYSFTTLSSLIGLAGANYKSFDDETVNWSVGLTLGISGLLLAANKTFEHKQKEERFRSCLDKLQVYKARLIGLKKVDEFDIYYSDWMKFVQNSQCTTTDTN